MSVWNWLAMDVSAANARRVRHCQKCVLCRLAANIAEMALTTTKFRSVRSWRDRIVRASIRHSRQFRRSRASSCLRADFFNLKLWCQHH